MADPAATTGQTNPSANSAAGAQNSVITSAISDINQEFKEREVQQKARELGISYIDIALVPINPDLLALIPKEEAARAEVMPFFRVGQKLRLALVDPEKVETKRVILELKNKNFVLNLNLCSRESLKRAQSTYANQYREKKEVIATVQQQNFGSIAATISTLEEMPKILAQLKSDEALNVLHEQALKMQISDLHFEPQENGYRLRARIDGILSEFFKLPKESQISTALVRQIKYNAHLKLNVTNVPQDGQYFFRTQDRLIDVRVSTLPTRRGESVVLRFLDPKRGIVDMAELGFSPFIKSKVEKALKSNNGLLLVTGPTGSGKTTTLYSLLMRLNSPEKKIITLEDPVEYHLAGIMQSQIEEGAGYGFANGLRSVLRQDPDIVMVGEIRDLETAETSVQAALTGHLVLSTLHTNSAVDAIPRFLNMGVKNYILAPAVRAIIAQRLVRKICPDCKKEREMTPPEKQEIFEALRAMQSRGEEIPEITPQLSEGTGCEKCGKTGFRGEMAIAEVLIVDAILQNAIFENAPPQELKKIALKNDFRSMWEEGILAVLEGKTTLAELMRGVGK